MARPGFIVPNAVQAGANLDLAEPDAVDFNLLGNLQYGVIVGCGVRVTGSSYTVSVDAGVAVVNSMLVLTGGSVMLPTPGQSPRFDLICVDTAGKVHGVIGTQDPNPVFPDPPTDYTVLAAVMIRPGTNPPQTADVIDKRIMLTERFMTAVKDGSLIHNADPSDLHPLFDMGFDGKMTFDGDNSVIERDPNGNGIHITLNLRVDGALSAGALQTSGDITTTGDLVGSNFRQGTGPPSGTAQAGDMYRDLTSGNVWVYQNGAWTQFSTVPIPAGMFMMGAMTTAPPGWLLMDGSTKLKTEVGGLWDVRPDWQTDASHMKLPDARNCYFAWGPPGSKFGNPTNQITLAVTNLPPHKHLVTPTAQADGSHTHTVTQQPAGDHSHLTGTLQGAHTHGLNDPGHSHPPEQSGGGPDQFLVRVFEGQSGFQLGNQPNVQQAQTGVSRTFIDITTTGSNHQHSTDIQGSHTHGFSINAGGSTHTHPIQENSVGNGTAFDIRPPSMGMYLYVKT